MPADSGLLAFDIWSLKDNLMLALKAVLVLRDLPLLDPALLVPIETAFLCDDELVDRRKD